MNSREYSMIMFIKNNDEITIDYLAKYHNVSEKTVRNDINNINSILKKNHLQALEIIEKGIIIKHNDFDQLQNFIIVKDFYTYKLSKKERVKLASVILALANDFITFQEIADKLMVSRGTIIKDSDEIKEYLSNWNILCESMPKKGILAIGDELSRRKLIFETKLINKLQLIKILGVNVSNLKILEKVLKEQEKIYGNYLTEESYEQLIFYLNIQVERNKLNKYLGNINGRTTFYYDMARSIEEALVQFFNIYMNENEVTYINEILSKSQYVRKEPMDDVIIQAKYFTKKIIKKVSKYLKVDLTTDFTLYDNLSQHLANSSKKEVMDYNMSHFFNKFLIENYIIVEALKENINLLIEYYNRSLSEYEIFLIALHISASIERKKNEQKNIKALIICNGGVGTSQLIMARLSNYFEFSQLKAISMHEIEASEVGEYSLILSTIDLGPVDFDYIKINPLLKDEDLLSIANHMQIINSNKSEFKPSYKKEINEILTVIKPLLSKRKIKDLDSVLSDISLALENKYNVAKKRNTKHGPLLKELLTEDFIKIDVECNSWKQTIKESGKILLDNECISSEYINAIEKNLVVNGPYVVFSKGFAFPHETFDKGSKQLGMSLIKLKKSVNYNSENDPVDFVCMISTIDQKSHLNSFFNFVSLLQNKKFKNALYEAETPQDIYKVIVEYESVIC